MSKQIVITLVILMSTITGVTNVSAVTSIEDKCIKRVFDIGYNITETHDNTMKALSGLEADCIYSGKLSHDVRCIIWSYDIAIRNSDIMEFDSGYMEFRTEQDLHIHECSNLDQLP